MKPSDAFYDQVCEDYLIYLEQLDPDCIPMDYQAYEWMRLRQEDFVWGQI